MQINRRVKVKDKDVSAILDLLPKDAHYYLCKPNVVRGLDSYLLKEKFDSLQLSNIDCQTVSNAFKMASNNAKTKDIIFVGGSTFVVGNFLELGY